jgi:hypothetical protein
MALCQIFQADFIFVFVNKNGVLLKLLPQIQIGHLTYLHEQSFQIFMEFIDSVPPGQLDLKRDVKLPAKWR